MALPRPGFLLLAMTVLAAGAAAAPPPATGTLIYSDLCHSGAGFAGSRLTLKRASDSGDYKWGDSAADTAPLSQLKLGADGVVAFRYMPDADNPEVYVHVSGALADDAFTGEADGKPLHLPRSGDAGGAIPPCHN